MRFLVDCYHPANFLVLKNAMRKLESDGHEVLWCVRDKDVICDLFEYEKIPYALLTYPQPGLFGRVKELIEHDAKLLGHAVAKRVNVVLGASVSVAHVGFVLPGVKSLVFSDDDIDVVRTFVRLSYPFTDYYITPDYLPENLGKKHIKHKSFHTLAYLHPDHFQADPKVMDEAGIEPGETYFVLRFVTLNAFHDVNAQGLSFEDKLGLIRFLEKKGRVIVSCEGNVDDELKKYIYNIHPAKLHTILANATMLVSDSQTMTAEAAVLGVPSIRCNSFVGRLAGLEELEHQYGLTKGILPVEKKTIFPLIESLLNRPGLKKEHQEKRQKLLEDKVNLAGWIYDFLTQTIVVKSR